MNRFSRALQKLTTLPALCAIRMVRLYQRTLSPLVGGHCRYQPTCSAYFIEAVEKKGFWIGSAKGIWRLLRCHPFSRGGYDPVEKVSGLDEAGQGSPGEPVGRDSDHPS
jgi:putative membrane protein insertion efficiency factor